MKTETFKGCEIPRDLTLRQCVAAIFYGKSGNSGNLCGGVHARGEAVSCGYIRCRDCILGQGNLNTLIEYVSSPRKPDNMPELKPGMAILLPDMVTRGYVCEVTGNEVVAYKMLPGARYGVELVKIIRCRRDAVSKVWYRTGDNRSPLTLDDLRAIMGVDGYKTIAVAEWTRMKKLTVDEISKLLGYTVEIVGSEKADD